MSRIWKIETVLTLFCLAMQPSTSVFAQDTVIECRKSDSSEIPKVRCGPTIPSFIPCAETGYCLSRWEQDVFGHTHVFYYCTGGSSTTFDPLFATFEKLPPVANEQGSNSLWLKQKRWCSARFACQEECQEMLGLGVKCVADANQFLDGTTIDYWVPILAVGNPIPCNLMAE